MIERRIKELLSDYQKALSRLQEGIHAEIPQDILVDAVIQRFEFTFELSWKLMKFYLNFQGVDCNSPRQTIKEAFKISLIESSEGWIDMLMDRNRTSHIYDEQAALEIYNKINSNYVKLFVLLLKRIKEEYEEVNGGETEKL